MKIAFRRGHNFQAIGTVGTLNEVEECEKIRKYVKEYLIKLGIDHKDVSPSNMKKGDDLNYGVTQANNFNADLFFSIHMNDDDKKEGTGCEIWTYSEQLPQSKVILKNLESLGFKNRGIKHNKNFIELNQTKMKAMIIECCFVYKDASLYKKVGAKAIAKAIVEGVTGKTISEGGYYRVITGSFQDRKNAEDRIKLLKEKGIDSFIEYKE